MDRPDGNQAWLWLSFVVVVCLSLNTLLIAKLRDSGIKPELLALYWFVLVGGGLAVTLVLEGNSLLLPASFLPPHRWWPILVLACAGLAGTVANVCFFSAVFNAPNPGYVTAIRSCEAVVVAVAAALLSGLFDKEYDLGVLQLSGIGLIVIGVVMLSMRPS
jgi:uncharacterized membrane protein